MTPAISAQAQRLEPVETIDHLRERVCDWSDPYEVAALAAEFLSGRMGRTAVSVFRVERRSSELVLLARSPAATHGSETPGIRLRPTAGLLARALREGTPQKRLNAYVEPDFVHSLPGQTRSEVVLPVISGEAVLGIIQLVYPGSDRPRDEDVELAEMAGLVLLPVLEASGSGVGAGEDDLISLAARISSAIAGSDDLEATQQMVAEGATRMTGATGALLLFRHSSRQALEVAARAGAVPQIADDLVAMDGTVIGEAVRAGRSRSWSARGAGATRFGAGDEAGEVRDGMVVPLTCGGKVFGALVAINRDAAGDYTPAEVEHLEVIARQAAPLEPMRQIGPLRRMLSDNSLIAEVGRAVTGTLGLDDVLALIVRAAEMLIGARGVAIGLLTREGDRLNLAATSGSLRSSRGQTVPVNGTLIGWAVAHATQAVSACVSDDPRGFEHEVRQGPGVVVPLESRARLWGALLVTRADGAPPPSDEDIDALRKLAGYASIAIDNAQLYREQTELSSALQAQTEELTRAYSELRASQERLVVSEKMAALGRITAGIAHEINSPLGGLLNCLQLADSYANEYRASIGDPEVGEEDHAAIATDLLGAIQMAEAATRKVAQFVRTIKGQTRTGDDSIRVTFPAEPEIAGVVSLLGHELRNREVHVCTQIEPGLVLVGDPGKFSQVVQNLVNNAIDAYEGGAGEVWIRMKRQEEDVVLEVEDHGCGIPEAIRPKIFDYLFTTKDVGKGTGLGLSIVHSIVTSAFDGEIAVESEPNAGTTFTVHFPPVTE